MTIYENKFEIGDKVTITNLGGQYLGWLSMSGMFRAKNYCQGKVVTDCVVLNYTLHPDHKKFVYMIEADNEEQYLYEENSLTHTIQGEKETEQVSTRTEYKQRSKWVKNTSEKPDLPDGTLVKVRWSDGDETVGIHNYMAWYISESPQVNIVKWKVVDDWNEVIDGKAPDIDSSTLVEVKNKKKYGGSKYKGNVDDFKWDMIKKWRYAKKD